jgi:hypothetical protein
MIKFGFSNNYLPDYIIESDVNLRYINELITKYSNKYDIMFNYEYTGSVTIDLSDHYRSIDNTLIDKDTNETIDYTIYNDTRKMINDIVDYRFDIELPTILNEIVYMLRNYMLDYYNSKLNENT